MPLRIFRSRNVSGANLVQMLMIAAMFAFQILVALYLQNVLGYGAADTGLAMLPAAVVIGDRVAGRLRTAVARFGERAVLLAGLALLAAALGLLARLPVHAGYVTDLLPVHAADRRRRPGPRRRLPRSACPPPKRRDAGVASGLFNTTQQIGMARSASPC